MHTTVHATSAFIEAYKLFEIHTQIHVQPMISTKLHKAGTPATTSYMSDVTPCSYEIHEVQALPAGLVTGSYADERHMCSVEMVSDTDVQYCDHTAQVELNIYGHADRVKHCWLCQIYTATV